MPGIVETMSTQGLFLLGGSVAFDAAAEAFVPAAGGAQAAIALLLQGGNNWQDYVPQYVEPWIQRGVTRYYPIVPREDGTLDLDAAAATLRAATGIFVGGGHTPTYRRLYAVEPIRSIIRDRYQQGVPYAGVSAGALIAPEICAIPPEDTGEPAVQVPPGLGLIRDVIVGVHFTEWNALPHVLEAMSQTQPTKAWGIDEDDCALFEGGQFKRALGGSVYEIRMTDSAAQTYQITEHRAPG
jgi:cyanophycinase